MIQAAKLQIEVDAETRDAQRGIEAVNDKLNSATRSMSRVGLGMSAAVTAPLLGIATAALQSAGGFEQSMNILQQVVGATAGDMASLQEEALRLGAVTSFSAGEAAEAMLELAKAGMDTEEIMASIGGVMDLAAAGGVSLAEAANLTAAALNAFGLEASESGRIANMLAAAANASAADVSDLGAGLRQAGFAFSLANQPIENLVASLAILSNVGLTGSDAGTALKNAFMRMINPTAEAASLMKELGISFYDASGAMRQLPEIIDILNGALSGLTPQQRDAALATIFLSDGMKAMIPLLDQGSAGFNAMVGEVTQAGAASEVADARMRGLSGGIEYLRGAIDSFLIGAALPFTEMLGNLARGAGDALTAFGALPAPVLAATLAFAGVLAAAGPLMLALAGITAALSFLISPIGLVITATAALAAAWAADIGGIQAITATVFGNVQSWFASTAASAQALGTSMQAAFANTKFPSLTTLWEQFKAGDFQRIADTIRTTAFDLMVNLDAELNITAQANQLRQQLIGVVQGLGTAIGNIDFGAARANLDGLRDNLLSGLSAAIDGADWAQGGATFAGMISSLASALRGLDFSGIDWAGVLTSRLLGPLGAALMALQWTISSDQFSGLKTSVQEAIAEISWSDLAISFGELSSAIGEQLTKIGTDMAADVGRFFAGIRLPEITLPELTLPRVTFEGSLTFAADILRGMTNAINSVNWEAAGAGFIDFITKPFQDVNVTMGVIGGWITSWGMTLGTWIDGLGTALSGMSTRLGQWLAVTSVSITSAWEASGMSAAFAGLLTSLSTALEGFLTGAREAIAARVTAVFTGFGETVSGLWSDFTISAPEFNWQDFIPEPLAWSTFIPASLTWDSFVTSITWSSFIPDVSWDSIIPDFGWGDFVPDLDWGRFIPFLRLPSGGGADSGGGGFNATGTPYWQGGLSWVGERGPELVDLPRGSRVYSNRESMAMAGGGGITVHIDNVNLASDMDVHSMAAKLAREIQKRIR